MAKNSTTKAPAKARRSTATSARAKRLAEVRAAYGAVWDNTKTQNTDDVVRLGEAIRRLERAR